MAAILCAADIIRKYDFEHTIRFVAFDGEEIGKVGSHYYVEEIYNNSDNIIAALDADMIGFALNQSQGNKVKIEENGLSSSEWITDFIDDIAQQYYEYIQLEVVPAEVPGSSDHYSFSQFGYNAVLFSEYEENPHYHSKNDTIENMNITYSTKISKLMLATCARLSSIGNIRPYTKISGPTEGKPLVKYTYTIMAIDPENDSVYFFVDWDDGSNTGWFGPYTNGEIVTISHRWIKRGYYTINAKSKDIHGSESNWATLDISMFFLDSQTVTQSSSQPNTQPSGTTTQSTTSSTITSSQTSTQPNSSTQQSAPTGTTTISASTPAAATTTVTSSAPISKSVGLSTNR